MKAVVFWTFAGFLIACMSFLFLIAWPIHIVLAWSMNSPIRETGPIAAARLFIDEFRDMYEESR